MRCPKYLCVLRTSTRGQYTCIPMANQDAFGVAHQPDLGHIHGPPPVASLHICDCNQLIRRDIAVSDSATWSQVYRRLPIPLFFRLSRGVVLNIVNLKQVVWNNRDMPHEKHCGSAQYVASLVCKHSCWSSYLQYMVLCTFNRVSFKASMFSKTCWIAMLCL